MKWTIIRYSGRLTFGGNPVLVVKVDDVVYEVIRTAEFWSFQIRNQMSEAEAKAFDSDCDEYFNKTYDTKKCADCDGTGWDKAVIGRMCFGCRGTGVQ